MRGSNDWTDATLQIALNEGAYYNRTTGDCPSDKNGVTTPCDFSENSETPGLTEKAKEMIDTITWNLGGYDVWGRSGLITKIFYNYERGSEVYHNEIITRPTLWQGQIGLMYPSDYGYATSGGEKINRAACLAKDLYNWNMKDTNEPYQTDCAYNDWLLNKDEIQWTLMPPSSYHDSAYNVLYTGIVNGARSSYISAVSPVLYLKPEVAIANGSGTSDDPYVLS